MVVERCLAEGPARGEGFAFNASLITGDANKRRSFPGEEWQAPQDGGAAVRESGAARRCSLRRVSVGFLCKRRTDNTDQPGLDAGP
jgi:hypothetical protein